MSLDVSRGLWVLGSQVVGVGVRCSLESDGGVSDDAHEDGEVEVVDGPDGIHTGRPALGGRLWVRRDAMQIVHAASASHAALALLEAQDVHGIALVAPEQLVPETRRLRDEPCADVLARVDQAHVRDIGPLARLRTA